jgi:pimeloyl-ACP methyl ester carboxylesterase
MTTPLLFLSGAGLQPWIWDDVRAKVSRPTHVAQYPSEGSLADYASKTLDEAPERFILVAHSAGGVVGCQLLAQSPERVHGFLGISALAPVPGQSFLGALPTATRMFTSLIMRMAGTRPPAKALRASMANDLEPTVADRIVETFKPESQHLYRDPLPARQLPELRGYIRTSNDKQVPVAVQDRYAAILDTSWIRTLATGHLPMLADPHGLVSLLDEFLPAEEV